LARKLSDALARDVDTDLGVLERLVAPAGKDVVDIGCGGGALVRALTGVGARMVGVEISEQQLAGAIADDGSSGARYLVGRGEDLPLPDSSVDVAVFMRTLHHVPIGEQTAALREASRVSRPGGVVYVVEPLAEGDYFELVSMVEDEIEVREAAARALCDAASAGLDRATTVEYDVALTVASLAALRARVVSVDPERTAMFDAREDELGAALARLGEPGEAEGERRFLQPMRADLLRPLSR
jgi:SAM-dependent methyltransferase